MTALYIALMLTLITLAGWVLFPDLRDEARGGRVIMLPHEGVTDHKE